MNRYNYTQGWPKVTGVENMTELGQDRGSANQRSLCRGVVLKPQIFFTSAIGWCLLGSSLSAQVVPDGSMGTQVDTSNNVSEITGGTSAARNLFHSFQGFSLEAGETAFFNNDSSIEHIIGRVTGEGASSIDGLLRANGTANLVLINPSGISLGDGARLDIGGSFLGTTAESINFADGTTLNTDLNSTPLLTISAPIGLQLGQDSAPAELTDSSLAVEPRSTFALVGNGISLTGGEVNVESGRIELGSVSQGEVSLTEVAAGWQLGYLDVEQFGELRGVDTALLNPNPEANSTGGIQLQGANITLERSQVSATALSDTVGGKITIGASESLSLLGTDPAGSQINNDVAEEATGTGGGIEIDTARLEIAPGSFIGSTTFGAGTAGNIDVTATEIEITGTGFEEFQQVYQLNAFNGTLQPSDRLTGIFAGTATTGTAGNIAIATDTFRLSQGAIIFNPVFTEGTGGNIALTAKDARLDGSALEIGGGINSSATATLGNIDITTENLVISNGATAINLTFGDATGGDINVAAQDVELRDSPLNSIVSTGILTNTTLGAGDSGDINLRTDRLSIFNASITSNSGAILPSDGRVIPVGGRGGDINIQAAESLESGGFTVNPVNPQVSLASGIGTSSYTDSPGGNLTIDTDRLIVRQGAEFASAAFGTGTGGRLTINAAESVVLSGAITPEGNGGGLFATSGDRDLKNLNAGGTAGDIRIRTPKLIVRDGATIDVQSFGIGAAGSLRIETDATLLQNEGTLSAATVSGAGGDITLNSNSLKIDRGQINASVFGSGTGGNIELNVRDTTEITGSGLASLQETLFNPDFLNLESLDDVEIEKIADGILAVNFGAGSPGRVELSTTDLQLTEGGLIATSTVGEGMAGSIFLTAANSLTLDASVILGSTIASGSGGSIAIDTHRLEVLNGGQISAATYAGGDGGSVTINATKSATVADFFTENHLSTIAVGSQPQSDTGNGGDLTINTPQLNLDRRGIISIGSAGTGNAGNLEVNAETITLNSQSAILADTESGAGANINLNANDIIWRGGSLTTATARGLGDGGNIMFNANNLVALDGSRVAADAFRGRGGNIEIDTQGLFVCPTCQVSASSQLGIDGIVDIQTVEPTRLDAVEVRPQPTQPQEEVAIACPAEGGASISRLTVTGRGGLPPRPQELLSAKSTIEFEGTSPTEESTSKPDPLPRPAKGWYRDKSGTMVLTSKANSQHYNSASASADCHK